MITIERRRSVPTAVRYIDNPMGTMTGGPPARLICIRSSEVSRHFSPPTAYQASGPEWMCAGAVIPGVKSASIKRRRVVFSCGDRKRSNFCNAISVGRSPVLVLDSHQPNFAKRFDNGASRPLVCLRREACWIRIEMPEHLWFCELTYGIVGQDPASNLLRSHTRRRARIAQNSNALRYQLCAQEK